MKKSTITYDGNEQETYTLFMNGIPYAELLVGEDAAIDITNTVQKYINTSEWPIIEIKNDDEKLGVIVDMWDEEQTDVMDSLTIWFEDYSEF